MPDSYYNLGTELLTATGQRNDVPKTVWLANGSFAVLWSQALGGGSLSHSVQLHSATGAKIGPPIVVDNSAAGDPQIAALTGGNFVVTWREFSTVTAQIYDPTGALVGSPITVASAVSSPDDGATIALGDGGFLVTWTTGAVPNGVSHAQRYTAAGATSGSSFDIVNGANVRDAIELANGHYVFSWGKGTQVFAAEFTAAGVIVGSAFQVNATPAGEPGQADMAVLSTGGYVITWTDFSLTGGDTDGRAVHARIYDAGGTPVSADFVVNMTTVGQQQGASVVALPAGGFLVSWTDDQNASTDLDIMGQVFDNSGNRVGEEFQINNISANGQAVGEISISATGVIAVPFADGSGVGAGNGPNNGESDIRVQLMVPAAATVDTFNATTEFTASADQGGWTSITGLAGGGYAVSWEIFNGSGTGASVQTRVFDALGHVIGSEVLISDSGNVSAQSNSDIASLTGGNYVVVWNDDGPGTTAIDIDNYDVRAQIMDASGNKVGSDFLVNSTTATGQYAPTVTGLSDGGFVVAWVDRSATGGDTDGTAIRAQIYDSSGSAVGGEFLVNTTTFGLAQLLPDVVSISGDRFLVTWSNGTLTNAITRAQIYDNDGTPVGSEIDVGAGDHSAAVGIGGGGFVVVFQAYNLVGITELKAQLFDSSGNAVGSAIPVNTNTAGNQQLADISALDGGGFVVSWSTQYNPYDTGTPAISAQIFDADGDKLGSEFTVSSANAVFSQQPSITQVDDGFAVAWSDGTRIETRLYSESTGQPVLQDDAVSGGESGVIAGDVVADNGGGIDAFPIGNNGRVTSVNGAALVSGHLMTLASGAHLVVNRDGTFVYDPNGVFDYLASAATGSDSFTYGAPGGVTATVTITINGSAPGAGVIEGTTGDDMLVGTSASETITGLQGNDYLQGLGGNDVIRGGLGTDIIDGGSGADAMDGGAGNDVYGVDDNGDTLTEIVGDGFDSVYASINYALAAGREIEILSVSNYSATTAINLTGNEFGQTIIGNDGNNFLIGGGGADGLYGGLGDDTFSVDTLDVVFDDGGNDTIYSSTNYELNAGSAIEILSANDFALTTPLNLTGNEFGQSIFGNAGNNFLIAGAGADGLYGKGGNDTYSIDSLDVVVENAHEGHDIVYTSTSFTLTAGNEVEVISVNDYAATTAINLSGNEFGQQIIGNAGANVLDGGAGGDQLIGNGGADTFAFTAALSSTSDIIADFVSGTDKIALDDAIFGFSPGALPSGAFALNAAGDSDDRIIYNTSTGQLFYDNNGNVAGGVILFATLTGHPTFVASDFIVI